MSLQTACNLTEGKSFGGRRTFADEKSVLMSTLVRLIGSLKANLDKKMMAQAASEYSNLKEEFKDALFGILDSYQKGEITSNVLESMWRSEIKDSWENAYELGVRSVGNPFGIWEQDKTWLKGAENEEYGYLGSFVDDIKANELAMGIEDRLNMYVETLDGVYHHGMVDGSPEFVKIHWILKEAKHCFPAGTKISTPDGEKPIEAILVGDLVDSLDGPRKVTRIYQRDYRGELTKVVSGTKSVRCTPNHPFLTRNGWVPVGCLERDSEVFVREDGSNFVYRKVCFPDSINSISAGGKVGILRSVSKALFALPFTEWLKSWVPMPIIPIRLDNDISNPSINNEFRFDKGVWFKLYAKVCQYCVEFLLKLCRFFTLKLLITRLEGQKSRCDDFRMVFSPIFYLLTNVFLFHWVVSKHVPFGFFVNNAACCFLGEFKAKLAGFILNLGWRLTQCLSYGAVAFCRVMRDKIINFVNSPYRPSYLLVPATGKAFCGFEITEPKFSANRAWFSPNGTLKSCVCSISANEGAEPFVKFPSPGSLERLFTLLAEKSYQRHDRSTYHEHRNSVNVYNLEVEDVHHYIANGFVVHNCDDCIKLAAGSPYTKKTLPAVPRDGTSRCLSNCRCELRFEYTEEKPTPEMYVIKGPRPMVPPAGYRLASHKEADRLGAMYAEIERLRGLIQATSGDAKKQLIIQRRDRNAAMIDFMEKHKVYWVPGGQTQKVKMVESIVDEIKRELLLEGGPGSGFFGHKGRPGLRGGSLPGGRISAHGFTGVGDWIVKHAVHVSASLSEKKRMYDAFKSVPPSHLKLSGVKTITVMNRLQEVDDLYHLRSGDSDRSFTANAFYDHERKEMVLSPGARRTTVLHEFAHSLVGLGVFKKKVWEANASTGKVTRYGATSMEEGFCEAYALRAVSKDYLRKRAPKVSDVMDKVFSL